MEFYLLRWLVSIAYAVMQERDNYHTYKAASKYFRWYYYVYQGPYNSMVEYRPFKL